MYEMLRKARKCIATVISAALVFSLTPVTQAEAEETTGMASGAFRQIEPGLVDNNLVAGTVISAEDVVFSTDRNFDKDKILTGFAEVGECTSPDWKLLVRNSDKSMEAEAEGGKITFEEGYDNGTGFSSKLVKIKHKPARDVLEDVNMESAVITTQDNKVLYYGHSSGQGSFNDSYSALSMPAGLVKGTYNMYLFAEHVDRNSNYDYCSDLGKPIKIEVVSSIKINAKDIDVPVAGNKPDTRAVVEITKNDSGGDSFDIPVIWRDDEGNELGGEDVFGSNIRYSAYIDMGIYGPVYFSNDENVQVNGKDAVIKWSKDKDTGEDSYVIYYTFKPTEPVNMGLVGSVSDGAIKLKAYTGITPPVEENGDYSYEWSRKDKDTTNTPAVVATNAEYVLTADDGGKILKAAAYSESKEIGSVLLDMGEPLLDVSILDGVSKKDVSYKGKFDGCITGLKEGMEYSSEKDGSYSKCTSGSLEGLGAGDYYIKIASGNFVPASVKEIRAVYKIREGKTITVKFDSKGGNEIADINGIIYNNPVTVPDMPAKDGYIFTGWYRDESCNNIWDFEEGVKEDMTLYAGWKNASTPVPDTTATSKPSSPAATATVKPSASSGVTATVKPSSPAVTATVKPSASSGVTATVKPSASPAATATATVKPSASPAATAKPGINIAAPGIHTPFGSLQTKAPVQTKTPAGTGMPSETQAPAAAQTPGQTQMPAQTPYATSAPLQTGLPEAVPSPAQSGTDASALPSPATDSADGNNGNAGQPDNSNGNDKNKPVGKGTTTVVKNVQYEGMGGGKVAVLAINAGDGKSVVIPDTIKSGGKVYKVTKVQEKAFYGSGIKEVTIGKNIKSIDDRAFKDCKDLTTVSLPGNLEEIGKGAFRNCTSLKNVKLPSSIKKIGKNAFKNNKSLKKVLIGTQKAGKNKMLSLRQGMTDVLLLGDADTTKLLGAAATQVTIGASAFENCIKLRSVVINSQVTRIGNSTFKHCKKLRSVLVKSLKLKSVGNKALKGVSNCKISVPAVRLKPYTELFKNKGQGKKVLVAKS